MARSSWSKGILWNEEQCGVKYPRNEYKSILYFLSIHIHNKHTWLLKLNRAAHTRKICEAKKTENMHLIIKNSLFGIM